MLLCIFIFTGCSNSFMLKVFLCLVIVYILLTYVQSRGSFFIFISSLATSAVFVCAFLTMLGPTASHSVLSVFCMIIFLNSAF